MTIPELRQLLMMVSLMESTVLQINAVTLNVRFSDLMALVKNVVLTHVLQMMVKIV